MSAPKLALISQQESSATPTWKSRLPKWWERLTVRCSGPDCPHRDKLWPHLVGRSSGIELDGRWYCEIGCLKPLLTLRVQNVLSSFLLDRARSYRVPLGLMLVNRGIITVPQMREALRHQRDAGQGRLGEWLIKLGIVADHQLTAALAQQWGCPVFPLHRGTISPAVTGLVPFPILESISAVPAYVSASGRILHVAFSERLDHTALYGIEQMLGCRTFACVASQPAVSALLDHLRRTSAAADPCFDTIRDPIEMTWTIANYAVELQAQRVALVRAGAFVWVRFFRGAQPRDLLFRILSSPATASVESAAAWPKVSTFPADETKESVSDATGLL